MKQGTVYAERLKKVYAKLRQGAAVPNPPDPIEPLRQLSIAILGVKYGELEAQRAVDRLLGIMTDWNEVRVSRSAEINAAMGPTDPHRAECCQRLISALQAIYDRENRVSLDHLRHLGRREAKQYLEGLDGVDEYAVASVALWSLGGHGIPIDDRLLEAMRQADLVHPEATRAEAQAFVERHIASGEAKTFCVLMRSFGDADNDGARSPKGIAGARRGAKRKKTP